jgi:hypothetical protein
VIRGDDSWLLICSRVARCLARAHACGIEPSRPLAKHFRSHSRTCRFNSARTSAWIKRARRTWLHLAPPSSSHLVTASASSPFLSACHAITTPPPSRGPWSTCIRAVPSVALSSTASDQCVVHHRSWHHFSRGQHFVEHLNCIPDMATPARRHSARRCPTQLLLFSCCRTRACSSLAESFPRTPELRAPLARATPAAATLLLLTRCHATAAAPPASAPRACTASHSRVHTPAPPSTAPSRVAAPPRTRCSTRAPGPLPAPLLAPGCSLPPGSHTCRARARSARRCLLTSVCRSRACSSACAPACTTSTTSCLLFRSLGPPLPRAPHLRSAPPARSPQRRSSSARAREPLCRLHAAPAPAPHARPAAASVPAEPPPRAQQLPPAAPPLAHQPTPLAPGVARRSGWPRTARPHAVVQAARAPPGACLRARAPVLRTLLPPTRAHVHLPHPTEP